MSKRDIVCFDLETTGVDTQKDRIVQYCFIKLTYDEKHDEYNREVKTAYINPGIPIPKEATEVHKITDDMVKKSHMFSVVAPYILPWIKGCVIMGYNSIRFDVPLLATEFERAGIPDHGLYDMDMIDAMVLYREYRPATLIAAAMDLLGKDIEGEAHDAEVDVSATIDVVDALRLELVCTEEDLIKKSRPEGMVDFAGKLKLNDDGDVIYAIGKAKGKRVIDDKGFGQWMLKNDFPKETKDKLKELL
jgi:DNA polymerase-3 subunit epsilon